MNVPTTKVPLDTVKGAVVRKSIRRINGKEGRGSVSYIASNLKNPDNIVVIYGVLTPPVTYAYDERNRMFKVN
ncbi:hypothetical protein [Caldivirga sp.]|uniref:hypothetical protein n=1 Tax=Caldivirga sp. TaxID=2080243 RepID=UPI0025C5F315|nr:hypothetical protein [Caldivirga sp.]